MCGLTALTTQCLTNRHLDFLRQLYHESTVRGLHAFGAVWGLPGRDSHFIRSHSEHDILALFELELLYYLGQPLLFLGHARYDTSGDWQLLENNQPLEWQGHLLMFNGVIRMTTQLEYEVEFEQYYPHDNDGYIALHKYLTGKPLDTLLQDPKVSFAGFFSSHGYGYALRNERRPLWYGSLHDAKIFASTKDIFARACEITRDSIDAWIAPQEVPVGKEVPLW